MTAISRISRYIYISTFGPMKASSCPGEVLAGPGLPRISMTRGASLLLRRVIMVEREFGGGVGSNKCVAVECFKHDVLMIQLSDHHKNPVGRDDFVSVASFLFWNGDCSTSLPRRKPG